ncbi:putative transmembrane protein [Toxoplasma gondii CAST]|uniref:Putative transmembrane protein n=1 Tax=Toxoplasma gondii CAST TaxID=943122 RepID=A0A425HZ43_TOXGO|nr:putative transmembrane protein [Toxoplasma gondii CAST]
MCIYVYICILPGGLWLLRLVLERLEKKLRPWQLQRIFQAAFHSAQVSRHFKSVLGSHLVSQLAFLPGPSLAEFLPKCAELGITKKVENVVKINVISGKRIRAWNDSTLLIALGYPLVMYDIISPGNAIALFRRLRELAVDISYPAFDVALEGDQDGMYRRAVRRVNASLIPLKLMEARLRIFRRNIYQTFSPALAAWLRTIREAPLKLTSFLPPVDQAHVNAPLLAGLADLMAHFPSGVACLHPHLQGPFLLEAASPATQTFLEWDRPWLFCPTFKQFESRVYTEMKRRCLSEEGWKLISVSVEEFLSRPLSDRRRWLLAQLKRHLLGEAEAARFGTEEWQEG